MIKGKKWADGMTSTADMLQLSAAANALTRLLATGHVCLGIQRRIQALWERHTLTSVMACCCSSKAYASASLYPESVSSSSNGLYVTSRCKSPLACSMQCLTLQPWYQATESALSLPPENQGHTAGDQALQHVCRSMHTQGRTHLDTGCRGLHR